MISSIDFTAEDKHRFETFSNLNLKKNRPLEVIFRYNDIITAGCVKDKTDTYFTLGTRTKFYFCKIQSPFYDYLTGKEIQM